MTTLLFYKIKIDQNWSKIRELLSKQSWNILYIPKSKATLKRKNKATSSYTLDILGSVSMTFRLRMVNMFFVRCFCILSPCSRPLIRSVIMNYFTQWQASWTTTSVRSIPEATKSGNAKRTKGVMNRLTAIAHLRKCKQLLQALAAACFHWASLSNGDLIVTCTALSRCAAKMIESIWIRWVLRRIAARMPACYPQTQYPKTIYNSYCIRVACVAFSLRSIEYMTGHKTDVLSKASHPRVLAPSPAYAHAEGFLQRQLLHCHGAIAQGEAWCQNDLSRERWSLISATVSHWGKNSKHIKQQGGRLSNLIGELAESALIGAQVPRITNLSKHDAWHLTCKS